MRDRSRAAKLMAPLSGEDLIHAVANETRKAAVHGQAAWRWQEGQHMAGCGRAVASFPLGADTFDALFDRCTSFRASVTFLRRGHPL